MLALEVVVGAAVLVGVAWLASRGGGGLDDADVDRRDLGLPTDRLLTADDIGRLRFRAISGLWGGLRGYRFDDVDAAMVKVEEALRAHESRGTLGATETGTRGATETGTRGAGGPGAASPS